MLGRDDGLAVKTELHGQSRVFFQPCKVGYKGKGRINGQHARSLAGREQAGAGIGYFCPFGGALRAHALEQSHRHAVGYVSAHADAHKLAGRNPPDHDRLRAG